MAYGNLPWKKRIYHFTPAWHTINMGTGIISILFHSYPYGSQTLAMQYIALGFLFLNLAFFIVFTCFGIARYTLFRGIWSTMLRHPVQSLYLGAFPMGFSTLIVASVGILYERFNFGGPPFLYALWGLWWVITAQAVLVYFGQLHIMFTRQSHSINAMTTVWLLPVVTPIVISSAGAFTALSLQTLSVSHALLTMAVCLVLVVIGVSVALMMLTIYLHRLIVYGLPEGITIFSAFLPLGPLGQAGYAFLILGQLARDLLPQRSELLLSDARTPQIIDVICFCISFVLWSLASAWVVIAVLAVTETILKHKLPFRITFWGMIFPNGVYANLTIQFATALDSRFFRVWGAIYAVFTLLLWTFAMAQTVPGVWDGSAFQAPCLEETEERHGPTPVPPKEKKSSPA